MRTPAERDRTAIRRRKFAVYGAVAYCLFMSAILSLLLVARNSVVHRTDPAAATRDWQTWVEDVKKQSDTAGPVERQEPETAEPPAVLLLRDMFPLCVFATILFGTVLFGSFWWLLRGALFAGDPPADPTAGE